MKKYIFSLENSIKLKDNRNIIFVISRLMRKILGEIINVNRYVRQKNRNDSNF